METYEIYNLPIHELVTATFSLDWSMDNQISLITPQGTHIFELQPNPLCGSPAAKFKRSFMYATNYRPCEPFIPIIEPLINNFDREDLYLAMFEEALTPKLSDKDDIIPRIVTIAWSPAKLLSPSKCLLATVTSGGAVDLTLKSGKNWYSICNITASWWNIIKNELDFDPENVEVDSIDAQIFKKNLRRLQGTAICWSELYDANCSTCFSYFVTAYRSCDLAIWKITRVPELPTLIKPTLIKRTHFDIDAKITKVFWIKLDTEKYLILIGFLDGRIYCINQNILEKHVTITNSDDIPISEMKEWSRTNNEINIIVAKSFFLIVITIDHKGEVVRQHHIQLPGLCITGLQLIDENSAILTTQDAKMFFIKLKDGRKLVYESINCDVKASKIQFLGLARASSGVTFINITSPNGLYDHLINREPSTLQMFGFKGELWNPWNVLKNKNSDACNIHWDCIETIRIRASKETDPENYLPMIPQSLEMLSVHQLRYVMWLTLITEVLKQKKIMKKIDNLIGEISDAQPLIFVHCASNHIIRLAEKKYLTDDMRLSIHFLQLYLEIFLAGEDDDGHDRNNIALKIAKNALRITKNLDLIEVELCNLCGKSVTELPWNTAKCPDGHRLPRCALTLLQITCLKYRSCPACSRIYHPSLDEEYNDVKCIYCDISVVYDNRIVGIGDELEKSCQNLSIEPLWKTQASKSQESDTSVVNEKRNKKRRATANDTFTLIVNKDDENITETWQEL